MVLNNFITVLKQTLIIMYASTSDMSRVSLDFSMNPSRGNALSVLHGSRSWESKISSREKKFSSIPIPGGTGM